MLGKSEESLPRKSGDLDAGHRKQREGMQGDEPLCDLFQDRQGSWSTRLV